MSVFRNDVNLINRRGQREETDNNAYSNSLTITEKVCMLSLKNLHHSAWNDNLSLSLRGCILIDLHLRGRIELEPKRARRKTLSNRAIVIKDPSLTGERLLDQTLKHIKTTNPPISLALWLEYLNGENWNPWTWKFQLKTVRERLSKDLVEKGYFKLEKIDYLLFESTKYTLVEEKPQAALIKECLDTLLDNWKGSAGKLGAESLALVMMCSAASIVEDLLVDLDGEKSDLAKARLDNLLSSDYEKEAELRPEYDFLWAVFSIVLC